MQCYTDTLSALLIPHVCPLGMCVVLLPNIGNKNAHSSSESSCVCTGNVYGATAKFLC